MTGHYSHKPGVYPHHFVYQREQFLHGRCVKTDWVEVWLLDRRDYHALLAHWNRQPTSPITGIGWHYSPVYS